MKMIWRLVLNKYGKTASDLRSKMFEEYSGTWNMQPYISTF